MPSTIRLMFWGISRPKTRSRVFSFWSLANNMGQFIGPFIGGLLAEPVLQYPGVFKGATLFENYPFALPSLTAGVMVLLGMLSLAFFFHEVSHSFAAGLIVAKSNRTSRKTCRATRMRACRWRR